MNFDELKIHSRHLPHWEAEGAVYFITFRTLSSELTIEEQIAVKKHIIDGNTKFYTLIAAIVMPDHVHLLLFPLHAFSLAQIMKGIKGVSARKINEMRRNKGSIWQDESFDRIVRDENELMEKFFYMLNNPVKRELTDDPWNYFGWWSNPDVIIR
jgi:putative transposase